MGATPSNSRNDSSVCTCASLASNCLCNCANCSVGKHCYCADFCKRRGLTSTQRMLWKNGLSIPAPTWQGPNFSTFGYDERGLSRMATPSTVLTLPPTPRSHTCTQCSGNSCAGKDCPCSCHRHINGKPIYANMYGMGFDGRVGANSIQLKGYNGDAVATMESFSAGKKCLCGKTPCYCQPNNYQPTPLMANMWGME